MEGINQQLNAIVDSRGITFVNPVNQRLYGAVSVGEKSINALSLEQQLKVVLDCLLTIHGFTIKQLVEMTIFEADETEKDTQLTGYLRTFLSSLATSTVENGIIYIRIPKND